MARFIERRCRMLGSMPHRFHIVDVFAEERYAGNQLAVVCGAEALSASAMQRIALEFGFSETTFVVSDPHSRGAGTGVRIFTPTQELPFAGHPTLGTAWVLREHLLGERPDHVTLALGVGAVPVTFAPEGAREVAWLTAPPIQLGRTLDADQIAPALGLSPRDLVPELPTQHLLAGVEFTHVPLASVDALERFRLDPAAFASFDAAGFPPHVYAFARDAGGATDLRARMQLYEQGDATQGVREDPATGSATACLGAYLLRHEGVEASLRIAQGVEMGRPSLLRLEATGDPGHPNVRVGGCVVEVARGELL
jgi:trans-2,3-dihydro-3-hydroxyanthranilate isomerase